MPPVAWVSALVIGASLGLLGSGGSILTVPVLVYALDQPDKTAIAGSLAIVGGIATAGAVMAGVRHQIRWRTAVLFGAAGVPGAWVGTALSGLVSGAVQLTTFAVVMLAAAWFTLHARPDDTRPPSCRRCAVQIALEGALIGLLTGFVGVGGGFLIVPALVLLGGLPMHKAVGTSLLIVAVNSWTGLLTHVAQDPVPIAFDWRLIGLFIAVGAVGSILGQVAAGRLPQHQLKVAFALFLVAAGVFVLWRTVPQVF